LAENKVKARIKGNFKDMMEKGLIRPVWKGKYVYALPID
jgi:hypothetical protein